MTNDVHLIGRVSGDPDERDLPSGDRLVTLRVVVPREAARRRTPRSPRVDTIDVSCFGAAARRAAGGLKSDDTVEILGALRRQFFKGATGAQSRYQVEARKVRRVREPAGD